MAEHATQDLLRFITCGSVDDGKSTLIGRLLHDADGLFDDVRKDINATNLAHITDGLQAEREQGITIDVAYRYFASSKRKFIIADVPGHEQYTRNMATGASTSDLAVILIDAQHGVQAQTRRHSFIVSLLGIRNVIVAINKLDLFGFDQARYKAIQQDYLQVAAQLEIPDIHFVPVSALHGDNIVNKSPNTPWFRGRTLLDYLERAHIDRSRNDKDFRFPVQWVNRPHADFRGYAGTIASGRIRKGDAIRVMPSGVISSIDSITTFDGELPQAEAGQAVTLTLNDKVDVSRGDMLVNTSSLAQMSDRLRARIVWLSPTPMNRDSDYLLKSTSQELRAWPEKIHHRIDVHTFAEQATDELQLNEIGLVDFGLHQPLVFDRYKKNRRTGAFILIDRMTNATVGAGLIEQPLATSPALAQRQAPEQAANNLHPQPPRISAAKRAEQKQQQPAVIWFTGLSGSGKSSIASALDELLTAHNKHSYLLDGDTMRQGLNRDLSFRESDRRENIRRIGEVAKLFSDAGLITLAAFISPFREDRQLVRELLPEGQFIEVFVDTPLEVCEQRDVKGLYAKARKGEIRQFTGISSPYEAPEKPDIHIRTEEMSVEDAARVVFEYLLNQVPFKKQ
ncbi:sulfate adenylyltransferase subunit CysN [Pseudidiomarina salinarum]|uniref:sulfate adenylyltransferase subunit CysN n=1 Tax=Pseudidiomarina salinarum TaxID=435908 RepID=UPI00068F5CEF|nr:sulfate adenylyltransferase subunit CysN [Pseudidiomarina salinarum]RUO70874.1 adenylyl-sulfate kinase [Pseudidiomarina salinarum]